MTLFIDGKLVHWQGARFGQESACSSDVFFLSFRFGNGSESAGSRYWATRC